MKMSFILSWSIDLMQLHSNPWVFWKKMMGQFQNAYERRKDPGIIKTCLEKSNVEGDLFIDISLIIKL